MLALIGIKQNGLPSETENPFSNKNTYLGNM